MSTRRASIAVALATLFALAGVGKGDEAPPSEAGEKMASAPPVHYVLLHRPGKLWDHERPFREQPGIMEHVGYMAGLDEQGRIVAGGPFLDDSGGMMILRAEDLEGALETARSDPAVQKGLLEVQVKPWLVAMGSAD